MPDTEPRQPGTAASWPASLLAYPDAMGDVRSAATGLPVHPKTLRHRVRRAATVAGIDVDDPGQLLLCHLHLTPQGLPSRIGDVLKATRMTLLTSPVVSRLGELERAVMDVLWSAGEPMTVRAVHAGLADRDLAYTTVMTVLTRLAAKDLVKRERTGRAWLYAPVAGRAEYVAELMLEALELTGERGKALVRFANSVSIDEADTLRAALREQARRDTP